MLGGAGKVGGTVYHRVARVAGRFVAEPTAPYATGAPAVFPELVALKVAVRALTLRPAAVFTPDQLVVQASELLAQADILRRQAAVLIAEVDRTDEAQRQSFHSTHELVRHRCRLARNQASELLVVARHLDDLPMASAALDEGRVGFGHLAHLARTAAFMTESGRGKFDEVPLLALAEAESVSRFGYTCRDARHAQAPESVVEAEKRAVEMRELTFNLQDDGTCYLNARLDSTGAGVVRTVLEGMAVRCGADDTRAHPRRMADALIDMATDRLGKGNLSDVGGAPVAISIICTDRHFMGLPGAPGAHLEFAEDPISSESTARFSCNATITAMWIDGRLVEGELDFTHPRPTKRQRRLLAARDGGCRYPGCHKLPSQCEVHHVVFRRDGGRTKIDNMILLCSFHHWRVHEGGYKIGLRDDGQVFVLPPMNSLARAPGLPSAS